ncbi:hypothetical protein RE438_19185 [Bacillus wiedmannii]|uniref:hypothetical protein n=1 Tax=Bacillus wiedmannii TaxID=1890302 RepID=UPI00065B8FBD|nr:hypothetical protein [Bacillus wiedmannii]KMP71216.1 hypothetical protein TU62_28865 [Bacillus cereus]MCQ6544065.1 hypothetical protein [Bacillus wiedmannii]MCQ6573657.1 hypothetical protein [Bacillus wiedmannii]MCU5577375.1 hypothetical protein [Bacillus wiedmannii]WMS80581.1 hypothetical protein RE438_19185 [Bacillus wiedmannii]
MSNAIAAIRTLVESDEIIKANLSEYGEGEDRGPALTFQTAQDDMEMPYAIMRIEADNPDDVEIIERMILNFDVYCDNGDYDKAKLIATRIEKLLDREVGLKDDGILSIFRAGKLPIPDEDPSIIHMNVKFLVRTIRTDLY